MKSIKIAGKTFRLASRLSRLFAFFVDGTLLAVSLLLLFFIQSVLPPGPFFAFLSAALWIAGPKSNLRIRTLVLTQVALVFLLLPFLEEAPFHARPPHALALWSLGMLFMDGFKNGQGIGKNLLSLQVIRVKDGKPATFKDSFVRRLSGIFQPLDSLWSLGEKKQRMGDKFADTVVVKLAAEIEESEPPERVEPEQLLDDAIVEMTNRLAEARQKVDASIGIETQLRDAYEGALVQAERCQERASIAIQAGRDDLAREDLTRRNEYRQSAERYKTQWEEQQQIVAQLTALLETLQQKTAETQQKRDVVIAQHRNVDAHEHLRQMLAEVQDNEAFELLEKMEQDVSDASTLAKAAAEADVEFSDAKRDSEFAAYAEAASIDEELAQLKAKFQHQSGNADTRADTRADTHTEM